MTDPFEEWVQAVEPPDEFDPGELSAGMRAFFREVFDAQGPVTRTQLHEAIDRRQLRLARQAVELVGADLVRTTQLEAPPFEYRVEDECGTRIAYWGMFDSITLSAMQAAEVICEIADFMQGEVVEDLWTGWPICPEHNVGLYAHLIDERAVWHCRRYQHSVADIGQLQPPPARDLRRPSS